MKLSLPVLTLYALRIGCVAYLGFLTVLLLTPHPLELLGFRRSPWPLPNDRGAHFALFVGLAFLVNASRWGIAPGWLLGLLAVYGVGTELLQAFVPPRTVEWLDVMENLLGITAGTAIAWAVFRGCRPRKSRPTNSE